MHRPQYNYVQESVIFFEGVSVDVSIHTLYYIFFLDKNKCILQGHFTIGVLNILDVHEMKMMDDCTNCEPLPCKCIRYGQITTYSQVYTCLPVGIVISRFSVMQIHVW